MLTALCLSVLAFTLAPQQYTNVGGTKIPNTQGDTESAKFGDWDLDGDLDLVYANGGDAGNQQSRLFLNNGFAQGGTLGTFADATAASFIPNLPMSSRDVEPFDIDGDGDLDFFFANHSSNVTQSCVWFINQGGAQGGASGIFQIDQSRYVGLGQLGSSVPAAMVIGAGPFAGGYQDWSCQGDFADVDLDGDLDLYQSSYGVSFSGQVMARLFLSGAGVSLGSFTEYNPSGFLSNIPNLPMNSPAGFLEGFQADNTLDTAGSLHDITNLSLDLDFADLDGDFDLDVFAQSRDTRSRVYQNRYIENGGSLGSEPLGTRLYRDVTAAWGVNVADAGNNYDADLNDLDNDGDIDGYFVNYVGSTNDGWALNDGTGIFGPLNTVPGSGNDDNEVDFHDYDHDGDVDPFVSGFSVTDKFYKNQFVETGSVALVQVTGLAQGAGTRTLSADVGDMDNDGDADLIFAEDSNINEVLLENHINTPDPIAPRLTSISQLSPGAANSTPRAVTVRATDNVNLEYFRNATGFLLITVNGALKIASARWSGGNVWRAEIPGYWAGTVGYQFAIADHAGNLGISPAAAYTNALTGFSTYGAQTPGCHGSQTIAVNSAPTVPNPDFAITCTGAPPSTVQLCLITNSQGSGSDPFGLGFALWVGIVPGGQVYGVDSFVDPTGFETALVAIPNFPWLVGTNYYFQFIHAEASCAQFLSASPGGHLTLQP
jgi:hypothetical protein